MSEQNSIQKWGKWPVPLPLPDMSHLQQLEKLLPWPANLTWVRPIGAITSNTRLQTARYIYIYMVQIAQLGSNLCICIFVFLYLQKATSSRKAWNNWAKELCASAFAAFAMFAGAEDLPLTSHSIRMPCAHDLDIWGLWRSLNRKDKAKIYGWISGHVWTKFNTKVRKMTCANTREPPKTHVLVCRLNKDATLDHLYIVVPLPHLLLQEILDSPATVPLCTTNMS